MAAWKVTQQVETMGQDASGAWVRGYLVHFQLDSGVGGSVFVPRPVYEGGNAKQQVAALIAEHAAQLDAVSNLQG